MALISEALTTLENVKAYLDEDTTAHDTELTRLINVATYVIEGYCNRKLAARDYTDEEYDGNGLAEFQLPHYPVNSITSITLDDTALTEGTDQDYVLYSDEGILYKVDGVWTKGHKNIVVTYNAGYDSVPYDLEQACILLVKFYWRRGLSGISETYRTIENTPAPPPAMAWYMPNSVKTILSRYKEPVI